MHLLPQPQSALRLRNLVGSPRHSLKDVVAAVMLDPMLAAAVMRIANSAAFARGGADLVLSGHTHGGQLALPFAAERLNLARLSYLHHAGLYRLGASWLYVHPGLGTTGPPVRIGAAPEITVLCLRRGEGEAGRAHPRRMHPMRPRLQPIGRPHPPHPLSVRPSAGDRPHPPRP